MIVVQYIYYYILRLTGQCSTILLDNTTIHRASFPTFSCCHGSKGGKKKKSVRCVTRTALCVLDVSSVLRPGRAPTSTSRHRGLDAGAWREITPCYPQTPQLPSPLSWSKEGEGRWTSESQTFYCSNPLLVTTIHQHDYHRGNNRTRLTSFRSKRNEYMYIYVYILFFALTSKGQMIEFHSSVFERSLRKEDCARCNERWFVTLENRIGSGLRLQ